MAANIIKTVIHNGTEFRLSDKGAISLYDVSGRYVDTLKPSCARRLAETGHPVLQSIFDSDEMRGIQKNWEMNKEKQKLEKAVSKFETLAQKYAQAAADLKKVSGQ
jgi:hypothetical protein